MYYLIPTGFMRLTSEIEGKRLIEYRCSKCGKKHLQEYCISAKRSRFYHIFGGKKAKEKAEKQLENDLIKDLEKTDEMLFRAINIDFEYENVCFPVVCDNCNEKQPWSIIPRKWTKTLLFLIWIFVSIYGLILNAGGVYYVGLPLLIVSTAVPIVYNVIRDKKIESIKQIQIEKPHYYNETNIHEIEERFQKEEN